MLRPSNGSTLEWSMSTVDNRASVEVRGQRVGRGFTDRNRRVTLNRFPKHRQVQEKQQRQSAEHAAYSVQFAPPCEQTFRFD